MKSHVLAAIVGLIAPCLAFAQAANAKVPPTALNVNVVNMPTVKLLPNATFTLDFIFGIDSGQRDNSALRVVKTTATMVVEQVHGHCSLPEEEQILTALLFVTRGEGSRIDETANVPLLPFTETPAPYEVGRKLAWRAPLLTRIYGEPGDGQVRLAVSVTRLSNDGAVSCEFQVSGHYE